jgi:hypothetical protein
VYQSIKYSIRFIVTAPIVFICFLQASEQSNKPIYFELGPGAECNYCHIVKDHLFPIFIALTEIQRQRTFNQNRFFCNKQPFKPEVFKVIADNAPRVSRYNPDTMYKISLNMPGEPKTLAKYFDLFLSQLHERFDIKHVPANLHKRTITLVQRNSRCRNFVNTEQLCSTLQDYCTAKNYTFKKVYLEHASFQQQLQLTDDTDIFIACHGAALTNAPFIRKNGIVIEIFPYNFGRNMFYGFTAQCRPDIRYHQLTLKKNECFPTTSKSLEKEFEYRYWRDQDIYVSPQQLISILEHP